MKTSKSISTISYNSEKFLQDQLQNAIDDGLISFYAYIKHKGEKQDDETSGKDHIHLFLLPAKLISTDHLKKEYFTEIDVYKDKPLTCTLFRSSVFSDWVQYVLHDRFYLQKKGLQKQYYYKFDELHTNDFDTMVEWYREISMLEKSVFEDMVQSITLGVTWNEYFATGKVPIQQIRNYQEAFITLTRFYHDGLKVYKAQDELPEEFYK